MFWFVVAVVPSVAPPVLFVYFSLVGLMLFLVWCMLPLAVAIGGGRYLLIRLIVKLGHIVN